MHGTPLVLMKLPKEHQMALSSQVKESVNLAINHLREGLAFAARSEHPAIINSLADAITRLEHLESLEEFMQAVGSENPFGNMFKR